MKQQEQFMQEAITLSFEAMHSGKGGPFGAVVVKDGKIIARGMNMVTANNDPTAHAEIVAIRNACNFLQSFQLTGCEIYTSCEPCPMCMGAIYWARPSKVFYANTKKDAAQAGFDDHFIYEELALDYCNRKLQCQQLYHHNAIKAFEEWIKMETKTHY